MFATLTRAVARPSSGLLRRAATAKATININATGSAVPKNLRCASNLSKVLRAELEEEKLVAFDSDVTSMVKSLQQKGITIKDEPGVSLVRLFGPGKGDEKVTVEFDCDVEGDGDDGWQDDFDDESDKEGQEGVQQAQHVGDGEDHQDIDGDEDINDPGYRFTATITKGTKKMVLTGTATSEISVQGVRINPANVEWDSSLYRGPAFHELDPDLQDEMLAYLKERNVDNDLATFICMYADQKEQTEYVNWLQEVEKFVK